jgi:hypothetical protein
MSKKFVQKNIELSLEFDRYLQAHPDTLDNIPNKACVVMTVKGDETFNAASRTMAEKAREKKQRCIEAMKVGKNWILQPLAV